MINTTIANEEGSPASSFFLKEISTNCHGCVFAECHSHEGGMRSTQTGCGLGLIDKYRGQEDCEVVEAYDDTLDGGERTAEFYLINGRFCKYRRPESWKGEMDQGEAMARVTAECEIKTALIVPLLTSRGEPALRLDELGRLADSITEMAKKPHQVLFVNKQEKIHPQQLHEFLWGKLGSAVTWRIVRVLEDTGPYEKAGGRLLGRLVDIGAEKLDRKATHYAVFLPRHRVPCDFLVEIDLALTERMERFVLLTPDKKGAGLFVQRGLHDHPAVGGNSVMAVSDPATGAESVLWRLEDKVRALAEAEEGPLGDGGSYVRRVADVCKGFSRQ